jgi:hypothetical protein
MKHPRLRRILVRFAVGLATATVLLVPVCKAPALTTGAYLQCVLADQAVVACWTGTPVQLALTVRCPAQVVQRFAETSPSLRHELRATGLEPATRYEFTVEDAAGAVVDRGDFDTRGVDDGHPVRFAVFGDSGGQPVWLGMQRSPLFAVVPLHEWLPTPAPPRRIAELVHAADPDFVLHMGDVVYPAGSQEGYRTGFFRPFANLMRHAPVFPVLGNHDLMADGGDPFHANFVVPDSDAGRGSSSCGAPPRRRASRS